MALSRMNREQLMIRLEEAHGEPVPKGWSRSQILLRLTEIEGVESLRRPAKEQSPLRALEIELNKASRVKANLQEFVRSRLGLQVSGNETIEMLRLRGLEAAYRQTTGHPEDMVGFGQYADKKYYQIRDEENHYAQWCIKTAQEGQCCMKLERLAKWLMEENFQEAAPNNVEKPIKVGKAKKAATSSKSKSSDEGVAQLTAVVKQLAQEVKSLKEDKEARRKITSSSADEATSNSWEEMSVPA